jgi:hypothetical protein
LLHSHLSLSLEMGHGSDQAARYYIFGLWRLGLHVFDPAFDWAHREMGLISFVRIQTEICCSSLIGNCF